MLAFKIQNYLIYEYRTTSLAKSFLNKNLIIIMLYNSIESRADILLHFL